MKSVSVKGTKREALGKKGAKRLREQGDVPAVIYGHEELMHISVPFSELRKLIYTPNVYLIDLDIDGEVHKAIIQDLQWHPVEEQVLHIDFVKVEDDKPVKISVPIVLTGRAKGIKAGGKLKTNMRKLKVKALSEFLPDSIEIDITKLGIGDSYKVSELERANIEFLDNKSNLIVGVISSRAAAAGMLLPEDEEEEEAEGEEGAAEGGEAEGGETSEAEESSEQ
ncbi:MAG TPA: 50S ribosomal protein L25/general stress protein Ctc [Tangfeifania sp.]|nr:50S ribosomal protein L25/general stress protein Ctc [Tangfeifania sp.]